MRGTLFSASAARMRSIAVARRHVTPRLPSAPGVAASRLQHALLLRQVQGTSTRLYATAAKSSTRSAIKEPPVQTLVAAAQEAEEQEAPKSKEQLRWEKLGLNPRLAAQLLVSCPHLTHPTAAQRALLEALSSPSDVLLRAHTGTGKSLGLLLGLLAKPRVTVALPAGSSRKQAHLTASLVLLPSNELVAQYMAWTRALFPKTALPSLAPIVQALVRGDDAEAQLEALQRSPPHVLLATPTRLMEILAKPADAALLGLSTLRTLVLDEADALLDLPPRFPSSKLMWRHAKHPPAGLQVLEHVMRKRATFSGGAPIASAGLEPGKARKGDERRPDEDIRRTAHKAREAGLEHAKPLPRGRHTQPLQLVCVSATANAVLRHFLAARTGWLRTAVNDGAGRWIDCTGLSVGAAGAETAPLVRPASAATRKFGEEALEEDRPRSLPRSLQHVCLVVDAPKVDDGAMPALRNLDMPAAKSAVSPGGVPTAPSPSPRPTRRETRAAQRAETEHDGDEERRDGPSVVPTPYDENTIDAAMLRALAFAFAAEGVTRGLALIAPRWSLLRTRAALEELGVPVRFVSDPSSSSEEGEGELFLLQSTSARGLDLPALTHVYILGTAAVGDAVRYTHLAGRAGRIGATSADAPDEGRAKGRVVCFVRGLDVAGLPAGTHEWREEDGKRKRGAISSAEKKMGVMYRRLGLRTKEFALEKGLELLKSEEEEEAAPAGDVAEEASEEGVEEVTLEPQDAEAVEEALEEPKAASEPDAPSANVPR